MHGVDLPELHVKTVSGALVVDLHGSPSRIRLKSVSGDLTVRIPATAGFRLTAKTVSGRVVADGRHIGERRPGRTKGEVHDGDESVQIDAGSVSGDVTVLRPSAGTVYPRLARLEQEGLVVREEEGRKAVYRITPAGRAELAAAAKQARRNAREPHRTDRAAASGRYSREGQADVDRFRAEARDLLRRGDISAASLGQVPTALAQARTTIEQVVTTGTRL